MNPYIREAYRVRDIYGSEVLEMRGGEQEIDSRDIIRQTRLNPQLGSPASLLELWDGSTALKQDQYLRLHPDDLPKLEEAYTAIETNQQQDYHCECHDFHLEYQAKKKQLFLQDDIVQIVFRRGGLASFKRLLDTLNLHQTAPSIRHKV